MQRGSAVVVGTLMMVLIVALVWKGGRRSFTTEAPRVDAGSEIVASGDAGVAIDDLLAPATLPMDAGLLAFPPNAVAAGALSSDPGAALPSGSPKMVRFGVILVLYRGAQGAPASSRSKEDALVLARSIAEGAKTDFKGQLSRGDSGSMDDAGRIPRGVLEPAIEYVLFTMPSGTVSDPIDTPRGFWIVKRID